VLCDDNGLMTVASGDFRLGCGVELSISYVRGSFERRLASADTNS
jgi:hypothetical protein